MVGAYVAAVSVCVAGDFGPSAYASAGGIADVALGLSGADDTVSCHSVGAFIARPW
jgi:hypothetical protein